MTDVSISPKLNAKKRGRFLGLGLGASALKKHEDEDLAVYENQTALSPEQVEALNLLEKIFSDRVGRNKLITALSKAQITPNPTSAIRFCIAVSEYAAIKEKVEKKCKGRKIVAMFIQSGSMFQLPNEIPKSLEKEFAQDKFDNLLLLRASFMSEFATNEALLAKIKDMEL